MREMPTHGGSIDLQVNGYAGVDFNADELSAEDLRVACERLAADGVSGILATVITDDLPRMQRRLSNIVQARRADPVIADMIWGLHIEGPFLNPRPGFIGAHPAEFTRLARLEDMQKLIDAAEGLARIVTLAPESDVNVAVTRWLSNQGIVVSAGHCDPTIDQLRDAIDAGLSMFTHLGNGCPLQLHRHDNIVQRVLSLADQLAIGFIADGTHIPFIALRNYLRCAGLDRAFVVTDAISAAGQGPGQYTLAGQQVVVDDNLATWAADKSHLFGSAATMPRLKQNLIDHLGLTHEEVDVLTRRNPIRAIGKI